jgi:hypothetical protein
MPDGLLEGADYSCRDPEDEQRHDCQSERRQDEQGDRGERRAVGRAAGIEADSADRWRLRRGQHADVVGPVHDGVLVYLCLRV